MSSSLEEFQAILDSKSSVDLESLCAASLHGIPDSLRRRVWLYLLGVCPSDKESEGLQRSLLLKEYSETEKDAGELNNRIRGETNRYVRTLKKSIATTNASHYHRAHKSSITAHSSRHAGLRRLTGDSEKQKDSPPLSASKSITSLTSFASTFSSSMCSNDSFPDIKSADGDVELPTSLVSSNADSFETEKRSQPVSPPLIPLPHEADESILNSSSDVPQYQNKMQDMPAVIQSIVSAFLNRHKQLDYVPSMVHICGPLALTIAEENEIYWCFEAIMHEIGPQFHSLRQRTTHFLMLFQLVLEDLYSHFEDEEVEIKAWADSWCSGLLAKELPLRSVFSLWDRYFAARGQISDLHTCVCLVILRSLKATLEEMECSEIHSFLAKLPVMEIDRLILQAFELRDELIAKNIF